MNDKIDFGIIAGFFGIIIGWFLNIISTYILEKRKEKRELKNEKRVKIEELLTIIKKMNESCKKNSISLMIDRFNSGYQNSINNLEEIKDIEILVSIFFKKSMKEFNELVKVINTPLVSNDEFGGEYSKSGYFKQSEIRNTLIENTALELIRACIKEVI